MFKLIVSDTLVIPVAGVMQVDGKATPFSFELLCRRSTSDELKDDLKPNADDEVSLKAFMLDRLTGWRGVLDEAGKPLEYGDETVEALLNFPGLAALSFESYMKHCGAKGKEKNSQK